MPAVRGLIALATLCFASITSPSQSIAQFVKVPITLENVVLQQPGLPDQPISLPFTGPMSLHPPCGQVQFGQLQVAVVNSGIDLSLSGETRSCAIGATLRFDLVFDVPVVSTNPETFIYFVSEPGSVQLVNAPSVPGTKGRALLGHSIGRAWSSDEAGIPFYGNLPANAESAGFQWTSDPVELQSDSVGLFPAPVMTGDRLRIPATISIQLIGPNPGGGNMTGNLSGRFEVRTRLPLPVSALPPSISIPIGVMGLTGFALMRG